MNFRKAFAAALAGAGLFWALLFILATGPGTITFPNSQNYGVTFGPAGEYHSTTALVDVNNPQNGIAFGQQTMSASLPVTLASNQPNIAVTCSGCSGGSGGLADEGTFTQGTTSFSPIGGIFNNTITNLASGQAGAVQLTADRSMFSNLNRVGGSTIVLGQGTMAASLPVALASNQSAIPSNVSQIGGSTLAFGQAAMAGSIPVVLPSNQSAIPVNATPVLATTGGATPYHLANGTGASTNSNSIKGSAGTLYTITGLNPTSTLNYLRVYDSAAAPTCSSATGLKHTYPIPHANGAGNGFTINLGPAGEAYANGIGYCVTGGSTDTDTTNAVATIMIEASFK